MGNLGSGGGGGGGGGMGAGSVGGMLQGVFDPFGNQPTDHLKNAKPAGQINRASQTQQPGMSTGTASSTGQGMSPAEQYLQAFARMGLY